MGRSSELDGLTTLPELLMQSIQKNGDREALRQYDRETGKWESWTYKELGEHVLAWRRAFAAMGLKPGERIAILMPNGRDHVCPIRLRLPMVSFRYRCMQLIRREQVLLLPSIVKLRL